MRTVITSRGVVEQLAFDHPGAQIELTAGHAYITVGPVTWCALLGGDES